MRKTLTVIAVSLAAVTAYGQNIYDAFTFAQNEYYGSARSIGMGNAVTAVGGDLGAIGINPAASAVAGYSQFTITPSVSLSTTSNAYTPVYQTPYTTEFKDSYSRAMLPNMGFSLNYETGRHFGLKRVTFGMVSNTTYDYTTSMFSEGTNTSTSMMGALAANAEGIRSSSLSDGNAYSNLYQYIPWNVITAYRGGMISPYGGYNDQYIGATEVLLGDEICLGGPLTQTYNMLRHGSKNDMVINVGLNFNNRWFLGANLGITSLTYSYAQSLVETPVNSDDFLLEYEDGTAVKLLSGRNRYSYNADGAGIYLKIGAIANPVAGLRIGAAIQTPTVLDITERWAYSSDTKFDRSSFNSAERSPEGEYTYRLRTPFRANVGAAYNILGIAMVSADYEISDYRRMLFSNYTFDGIASSTEGFEDVNNDIWDFAGIQHMLRAGVEVKPLPELAIRAGYNFTTSPEYIIDNYKRKNVNAPVSSYSAGMGFSSNGSFFADVACRYTKRPSAYVQPYDDYIDGTPSPEIRRNGGLWNFVATVGFRF